MSLGRLGFSRDLGGGPEGPGKNPNLDSHFGRGGAGPGHPARCPYQGNPPPFYPSLSRRMMAGARVLSRDRWVRSWAVSRLA